MKPEQIVDGFIVQDPTHNNCLAVAIANMLIHDGTFTIDQGFEYIDKITKQFDGNKYGIQITLVGQSLWELGYFTKLFIGVGDLEAIEKDMKNDWKCIRTFKSPSIIKWSGMGMFDKTQLQECREWTENYIKTYYPTITKDTTPRPDLFDAPTHAIYFYDFNKKEESIIGVNYIHKPTKLHWFNICPPQYHNAMRQNRLIGSEMILTAKKLEKMEFVDNGQMQNYK